TVHKMEVQNITSTDAINVTSTDSATSSLISVFPAADNITNVQHYQHHRFNNIFKKCFA
ncbi:18888_t:CDS:1, partial [Gigaspora rosea]